MNEELYNKLMFNLQKIALAYRGRDRHVALEVIDYIEEMLEPEVKE